MDGRFTLMRGFARFEKADDKKVHLEVAMSDGKVESITAGYALIATG